MDILYAYIVGFIVTWGVAIGFCINSDTINGSKEFSVPIITAILWPIMVIAYLTLVILGKKKQ